MGGRGATGIRNSYFEPSNMKSFTENNKSASWANNVKSKAQRAALANYVSDGYEDINGYLRGEKDYFDSQEVEEVKSDIENIEKSLGSLNRDTILYRGIYADPTEFKVGQTFKEKGFVSTTISKKNAEYFSTDNGTILRIVAKKGTKALEIGDNSRHPEEQEVLLNHGTKYKVVSKEANIVTMEVI